MRAIHAPPFPSARVAPHPWKFSRFDLIRRCISRGHRSIALVITLSQNRKAVLNFLIRTRNCHTENCSNILRRLGMARNNIREMVAEPCRSRWRRETTASSIYDGL